MRDSSIYSMKYHCDNCGFTYTEVFKFGERASKGSCTNCGCSPEVVPTIKYKAEERLC